MHSNIHHTINATEQTTRKDGHTLWHAHFRKLFALLFLMMASVGAWAQTNANYVPFEFYTSINQITGNFAIVNAAEGKALYGPDAQNIGYADYATAFANNRAVTQYALENAGNGNYRLRCVTPAGGNYLAWIENPCYLNAQPAIGGVLFNLGLNNQNGQDIRNGALWKLNYVEGNGWTIQNVAHNGYAAPNNTTRTQPYYWQLCSLADNSFANNNYVFYSGDNNGEYLGTSTDGTTTFNPSTCIWTGNNNGTFHNGNNNYLRNNNTWFLNSASNASNCILGGTENGTTGQTIRMGTNGTAYYLLYYNNQWVRWTTGSTVVFKVTRNILSTQITAPTLSGADQIAQLGNTTYTRTNAAYQPACYDYVFYNGAHHYCTSVTANATATRPSETFTYTWSLLNEDGTPYTGANVSVNNSGVVNYQSFFSSDTRLILRLTASSASKTFTADKTITFDSKQPTTLSFNNVAPTISADGWSIVLPPVTLMSGETTVTGRTITYSGTNCSVNNNGVVNNINGTATITATFAGDDTYAPSSTTYTITTTEHQALNETIVGDITITPATATLDLGGTQDYSVPASVTAMTRTCDQYTEYSFPVGTAYRYAGSGWQYTLTAPTITENPNATVNLTQVSWGFSGGAGNYYTPSTYYSTTSNVVTLTRTAEGVTSTQEYTITATAVYGSVNKMATAKVVIPAPILDLSGITANPASYSIAVNETADITCTYTINGVGQPYVDLVYSGYDNNIISVDANGRITGLAEGNTTVTIQSKKQDGSNGPRTTVSVEVANGNGTQANPYRISSVSGLEKINNNKDKYFIVTADFDASTFETEITGFTGTLDGNYHTISGLGSALFNSINGGTVKNVRLDNVSISSGDNNGNVGAIANTATNGAKIYNNGVLSGSVSGTRYVGSLVGAVSGSTMVINNYSYANVSGGTSAAGIVGYNNSENHKPFDDNTVIRIQQVASNRYLATGTDTKLVISDNATSNLQRWNLVASGSGFKLKNLGRATDPYVAQSGANGWTATFNNTGTVFTIEEVGDGTFRLSSANGRLGSDATTANSTVYTNKEVTHANAQWRIFIGNQQLTSLVSADLDNMIMNNMFYGNITSNGNIAPVFGGEDISNVGPNGKNTYNYYRYESQYSLLGDITQYNCALAAEERYLTRFEFYRNLLNSNRELAAWYATGSVDDAYNKMAKWVLDKSIAQYPILKPQGIYPSIINFDAANAPTTTERNKGGKLGTLSVSISQGTGAPEGANITTSSLTLNITDKDEDNYNYNYYKVQLPYYNEVGTGNYTNNKVVTGWKVSVRGGTHNFTTNSYDAPDYNFADRKSTGKDDYNTSGRVFAQGGYFNVPEGVTSISIQPYWGNAVYLSDPNYDVVYSIGYDATNVTTMGGRYTNGNSYTINGSNQNVYTTITNAINALQTGTTTVYDNAIVLVGNYHLYCGQNATLSSSKPFTVMSADLNNDNEPDYSFIYQHTDRQLIAPIRFDFLNWPGIGMAQKVEGTTRMPNQGIFCPRGWFEVTNTCIVRFTEFEYDNSDRGSNKARSPLILLGGIYEQFTSTQHGDVDRTTYIHLGDNAWFKEFQNGVHADDTKSTPHRPISVTGGEYEKFYLSGTFRPDANVATDNAECYINGGKFGEVAGAGQEQINGDVNWFIDHADIREFYGGGINAAKPITGDISVTMDNSYVDQYCGGPKFGNMSANKTVTTTATGSTFGKYFGAGYGGTSYNRVRTQNEYQQQDYSWDIWAGDYGRAYSNDNNGISTNYEYEFFAWAGGGSNANVGRFYVNYASLSLAQTNDVSSTLNNCTVLQDYYGGGSLGKVDGNATSELNGCTVYGNAFGGGFSATIPSLEVMNNAGFNPLPSYNGNVGVYNQGGYPATVTYTWSSKGSTSNPFTTDSEGNWIYTDVDLTALGVVSGNISLTVKNSNVLGTVVKYPTGSVFGGGDASSVRGHINVSVDESTVNGFVFGGGNKGEAGTQGQSQPFTYTKVIVDQSEVKQDVFGGGLGAPVYGNTAVWIKGENCFIHGSVLGGGFGGDVTGDTHVQIGGETDKYKKCHLTGGTADCND